MRRDWAEMTTAEQAVALRRLQARDAKLPRDPRTGLFLLVKPLTQRAKRGK